MKGIHVQKSISIPLMVLAIAVMAVPVFALDGAGDGPRCEGPQLEEPQRERTRSEKSLGEGRRQKFVEKILDELELTSEQKAALIENKKQHRQQMRALHGQIRDEQETIRNIFIKPEADRTALKEHADLLKELEGRKIDMHIDGMLAAKRILTPEQFTVFIEKMDGIRDRHAKMKKRRLMKMRPGNERMVPHTD